MRSKLACVIAEREEYKRDYQKLLEDNKKREEVSIVEFQITVLIVSLTVLISTIGILMDYLQILILILSKFNPLVPGVHQKVTHT